MTKNCREFTSC